MACDSGMRHLAQAGIHSHDREEALAKGLLEALSGDEIIDPLKDKHRAAGRCLSCMPRL
jgi:hypothetical protein